MVFKGVGFSNINKAVFLGACMVVGEVVGTSGDILKELGSVGRWLQAVGVVVVLWVVFELFSFIINWKRWKVLRTYQKDIKRIERKLDKVLEKR